ncbi:hypothetical protein I4U23_001204 [Adineta vaga]|nr:hypothetical protein I4U23_001204 [Adineta vaga]
MSSASNTTVMTTVVDYLVPLQNQISQYMLTAIFILGNFSNIANILVFLQKNLRTNACSWYFITVSVGHLIFLYFGCLTRVITSWSGFDLTRSSIYFCKIRSYFLACGLLISRHFLCMICIDRWMVTSSHTWIRRQSSVKSARWMIIGGAGLWFSFSICMLVWYRIEGSRGCVGASDTAFPTFYAIYNLVTILGPLFIMILFSLLVLINVRQVQQRRVATVTETTVITKKGLHYQRKDIQLIKLSLIQGIVYVLFTSIYAYSGTYSFFSQTMIKTRERTIIDGFISTIGVNISYLYMAATFFLYTLVSQTFRRETLSACQHVYRRYRC